MTVPKGINSLIASLSYDLNEDLERYKRAGYRSRGCQFYSVECENKMRRYAEGGELCEHKCEYCNHFKWIIDRAKNYAEASGKSVFDILEAFESRRDYWYMNFYQECNQPKIKDGSVRIFDTNEAFRKSVGDKGFRCPACGGISHKPQECDSGIVKNGKVCDWKSYGLFGTMGKGVHVFIIENLRLVEIFHPVAWEGNKHVD